MFRVIQQQSKLWAALKATVCFAVVICSTSLWAASFERADWLAVERTSNLAHYDTFPKSGSEFFRSEASYASKAKDLRMMLEGSEQDMAVTVDQLESSVEMDAKDWLSGLPKNQIKSQGLSGDAQRLSHAGRTECAFNSQEMFYECATLPPSINLGDEHVAVNKPQVVILAPAVRDEVPSDYGVNHNQVSSLATAPAQILPPSPLKKNIATLKPASSQPLGPVMTFLSKAKSIKLFRSSAGVVTTETGKISFEKMDDSIQLTLAPEVQKSHVSMFVRDPAVATVDSKKLMLTSKLMGITELFVVSKDRISIIPIHVSAAGSKTLAQLTIADHTSDHSESVVKEKTPSIQKNKSNDRLNLTVPEALASLDLLDKAAQGKMRSNFAGLSTASSGATDLTGAQAATPENLKVPSEFTDIDESHLTSISFGRAKAKTSFNRVFLRVIDERSSWNLSQVYPVGGVRVKILGTEFDTRSDGQGYVEITDIPTGSRVLLEVIDDTGAVMPTLAELYVDGSSSLKEKAQPVLVRRYLAMDYATRMAGLTQNMEKATVCGTAVDSSLKKAPLAGVRVGTDTKAHGPYYFNELGYLDARLGATRANGRFCFFNVEPGPMNIGFAKPAGESAGYVESSSAVVIMTARGRHSEEYFAMEDARHITTTVASVPTAAEQLSSDQERSNRYLPVEYAEVLPIGYKDSMIPIDESVYTSTTPIVPLRGRVWTVANSSDYEMSVQASSIRLPGSRQITSLLPRGFVDDMMNYAQASHNYDQGTVVVEHAAIAGQGAEAVKIRLIDTQGKDAGDGWYFSDKPVAKAIFFNVPPGVYAVMIETSTGHWIAADTAVAYPEASTFVRTGAPLEKHLTAASAQN